MTLYKHFPSKDDLIRAVLEERDKRFREWFFGRVEELGTSPQEKLVAVFDVLTEWIQGDDFRGCMFINAAAEFSSKNDAISQVASDHKVLMCEFLDGLVKDAGYSNPETLSYQLALLVEGAIVMGHVCGDKEAGAKAKEAALVLMAGA